MACVAAAEGPPAPAAYHVAPAGSDINPGAREKPFATLRRAQWAVRRLPRVGLKRDVIVHVRGGTYHLPEPVMFGSTDGGTDRLSVTYAARPDEAAAVSGRPVRG
jgi:hypothetical protein